MESDLWSAQDLRHVLDCVFAASQFGWFDAFAQTAAAQGFQVLSHGLPSACKLRNQVIAEHGLDMQHAQRTWQVSEDLGDALAKQEFGSVIHCEEIDSERIRDD